MRKLILLSTLVCTIVACVTSGTTIEAAESRAITVAKSLVFFGFKKPIGEMIESHPDIEQTSVKWFETDAVDGKSTVLCEFSFNTLVNVTLNKGIPVQTAEGIPVQIIFAVGKRGGEITQVQSLHPCDGGTHVCADLGVLLKALENKEDLSFAILGYTEKQFVELVPYYTGLTDYYSKRKNATERLELFNNPLSQEELAELKTLPLCYGDYFDQKKLEFTLGDFIETLSNEQTSKGLKIAAFMGDHQLYKVVVVNIITSRGEEGTLVFSYGSDRICIEQLPGCYNDAFKYSIWEGERLWSQEETAELMRGLLNVPDAE